MSKTPIIGITCDCALSKDYKTAQGIFSVQQKYPSTVVEYMGGVPLIIPNFPAMDLDALVATLDGLLVTGSAANVGSELYGLDPSVTPENERDNDRDHTTIPLIRKMIAAEKPILGICRGLQEMNVALGGTLQREIHTHAGNFKHILKDKGIDFDELYKVRQDITLSHNGILAGLNKGATKAVVNSVHGQAIDRLADDFVVEATCPIDNIIEAVRIKDYPTFGLAVQWHPEHREALETPFNQNIFKAFGDAMKS